MICGWAREKLARLFEIPADNENREKLVVICAERGLLVVNTFFKRKYSRVS